MDAELSSDADPARTKRPRRQPGLLKKDIVAAATDLFLRRGYEGTSMRDIAADASTSQAMLYRHFPSKAALFKETVVAPFHDVVARLLSEIHETSEADFPGPELFEHLTRYVYEVALRNRRQLIAMLAADEFSGDSLGQIAVDAGPGLKDLVAGLKATQSIRGWQAVDVEVAGRACVAMLLGMALLDGWLFGSSESGLSGERILDELAQFQMAGFSRQS